MISLLGMELNHAQNLLCALGFSYTITYCAAPKPLNRTDSVRVIRQSESNGCIQLLASKFRTKAGGWPE